MFDKIVIIDNTVTQPEADIITNGNPKAFFPIFSKRGYGKDSEVKFISGGNHAGLISKYGKPDLQTYLSPAYYAYEFLRGGGDAYIRRIVSPTSTFAHAVIVAKGKVVAGVDPAPDTYEVKFVVQTIADSNDLDGLITDAEALYSATDDANGYKTYPIAVFGLNWTGSIGNSFTFRLLPNISLEKVLDGQRAYQVEIKPDSSSEATVVEFSINSDAMLDDESVYANDIFSTSYPDAHFTVLNSVSLFLDAIKTYIPSTEKYVDILFGNSRADYTAYPLYTIAETSVDFTSVGGIAFAAGGDGGFATTEATRTDNMMDQYVASFEEIGTKILQNEYKYFIDYIFDFGATDEVKAAIISFANSRKSTSAVMDTGTTIKTTTALLTARKTGSSNYNDMDAILAGGIGVARDPFNGKKIVMPLSYFEAFAIPNHILTHDGGAEPFAGDKYTYSNMLPGTYQPYIYNDTDPVVTELIDNRINFAIEDSNGYSAYHQSTTQKVDSVLVERNNVFLLHRLIRICLLTAKAERWNWAEDSDIEKYQDRITRAVAFEMDGKFGEFKLVATREGLIGPSKNRVLVTATLRFKYINKGTTYKFIVV